MSQSAGQIAIGREGPDEERVRAAASGDRHATAALCASILPRVRNLIRYLVRGDSDVDDMAQEALIAILRGLPSYRGDGAFRSWADRVVARSTFAYLSRKRQTERRETSEPPDRLRRDDVDPRALARYIDALPSPGRADSYATRRDLVRQLDRLPPEQRHALVLHHAVGMSVPEIAEELRTPFETIRSRLRLGMAALRDLFGEGQEP